MKKLLVAAAIGVTSLVMGAEAAWARPAAIPPPQARVHACDRLDPKPFFCLGVPRP